MIYYPLIFSDKAKRKILKQDTVDYGDFRQPSFESEAVFVDKTISPDCIWEFQDVGKKYSLLPFI